jgi:hypothetical protein
MIGMAIVVMVSILALVMVVSVGKPAIDNAFSVYDEQEMEKIFHYIDNAMKETGGPNSARVLSFRNIKSIQVYNSTNSFEAELATSRNYTRFAEGRLMKIGGADVVCGDYTMENSYVKFVFRNISGSINTSQILVSAQEKRTGTVINFTDSAVFVDGSYSTGDGYTKMLRTGSNLPYCRMKAFINTSISYDIFYTLYAYADFLTIEVANICC